MIFGPRSGMSASRGRRLSRTRSVTGDVPRLWVLVSFICPRPYLRSYQRHVLGLMIYDLGMNAGSFPPEYRSLDSLKWVSVDDGPVRMETRVPKDLHTRSRLAGD